MKERTGQISLDLQERMLAVKQCLGCAHEGIIVTALDGTIIESTPPADHILETPSLGLKSRNIHEFCLASDAYGDLCAQASREGRALNRSVLISTGMGKKKLVNMSMERFDAGGEVASGPCISGLCGSADHGTAAAAVRETRNCGAVCFTDCP